MLDSESVAALLEARHGDPFAVLGLHLDAHGGGWLRALLPGAKQVVVSAKDPVSARLLQGAVGLGGSLEMTRRHNDGLFELHLRHCQTRFDYQLQVRWLDGSRGEYGDAYAYGELLSDDELAALSEGRHARPYTLLGAHLTELHGVRGVRFALWAPNARRVSVIGGFNQWDGRRHVMRLRHRAGVHEIFVPGLAAGEFYKYELIDARGNLLPLKADPYAFAAELRPGTASRVAGLPMARQRPVTRAAANHREAAISIYEVHPASWCKGRASQFPSWHELAEKLPAYAAELGFTHIELMPVAEHPFDGSWGYQTLGMFAPSARFGESEWFADFVAACHAQGVGVLLDWVPAHFPSDAHGLAQFDGTALYEYADAREGFHRDWNTLIYNFGRHEVQNFLRANALYWLERFALDGLRVDAVASMLYRDYSRPPGAWIPNQFGGRENLEAIALFKSLNEQIGSQQPGAITLAEESTAFPQVSAPTYAGGLGFHFKWNMGWMNDTLRYISGDPVHRRWHHEQMTFGLMYAFSENYVLPISHDEVVHGKGSMLEKMPGDDWQRFANLRAYYGFMWGHPGKKLLFMGQEFAQPYEWRHHEELPWHLLEQPQHRGVQRLIAALNFLYRECRALHEWDCREAGFRWLIGDDRENSIMAWARFDSLGAHALVICNFTPVVRSGYWIPLPEGSCTHYRVALNTDADAFGGSGVGENEPPHAVQQHAGTRRLQLTLPPLAAVFLLPA